MEKHTRKTALNFKKMETRPLAPLFSSPPPSFPRSESHIFWQLGSLAFESIVVAEERERRNASARRSLNKVGGFPLGAVNPAARQTLSGSFGLPGCGLGPDSTHGFILFAFGARAAAAPPLLCRKIKKLA